MKIGDIVIYVGESDFEKELHQGMKYEVNNFGYDCIKNIDYVCLKKENYTEYMDNDKLYYSDCVIVNRDNVIPSESKETFKPGDKLICVNDKDTGNKLKKGNKYVVHHGYSDENFVLIGLGEPYSEIGEYYSTRFDLVKENINEEESNSSIDQRKFNKNALSKFVKEMNLDYFKGKAVEAICHGIIPDAILYLEEILKERDNK